MLSIRMVRVGKKHAPAFRLVVQEKHRAPRSKYIEKLGHYIPHQQPKVIEINADRVLYWISEGAQPTDSVHNLLVSQGIVKGDKRGITSITKKRSSKLEDKKAEAKAKEEEKKAKEAEAKAQAEAEANAQAEKEVEAKADEEAVTPDATPADEKVEVVSSEASDESDAKDDAEAPEEDKK